MDGFCRDCLKIGPEQSPPRCTGCGSPRLIYHKELFSLSIAHLDCDAFFAAIEKRDNPALKDKPVIVGGGKRGVVSTACYIARTYGIHSAMPMFKALQACPDAVVVRPGTGDYGTAARMIRQEMETLTPLVQPMSIDEAFMDLTGTQRLHGLPPAVTLAVLALRIEEKVGITVSVGLSHNKFLAKLASDLDKPRGLAVIGREETISFLAPLPVSMIWGVGAKFNKALARDGFRTMEDLQNADPADLARRYGETGMRLARLCRGEDSRAVHPERGVKSVSNETTFFEDIVNRETLEDYLHDLSDKVSLRLKAKGLVGRTVTLKLKTAGFRLVTRSHTMDQPSNLAGKITDATISLLRGEIPVPRSREAYRLIGVGVSNLAEDNPEAQITLFGDPDHKMRSREAALDGLRDRFGKDVIGTGRKLRQKTRRSSENDQQD